MKSIPKDTGTTYGDLFNAQLFAELFHDKIKWNRKLGGWFVFNGKYWKLEDEDTIKLYSIQAHQELAKRLANVKEITALNHVKKSGSNGSLVAMAECAKAYLNTDLEKFDGNLDLFNCINGTYHLSEKKFYPFKPEDTLTKISKVEYSEWATCPRWDKFLDEIFLGDKELIEYMQRAIGYSLTASVQEQCMFILYGHGRNGKSKFIETVSEIMGDYAINCPSSMFVLKQQPGIPNDVARLKGTRLATASETNANINMDEELIKQLTGNKKVTARFLNKEFFDFEPTFKIFLATNHKPNIRGTDTGIWRRIQMIPFLLNVTEEQEDKSLGEKLLSESSGILNWIIEGYNKWREVGLKTPESVRKATELYREEEDDIGQFIKDECVFEKGGFIKSSDFKSKFHESMGYHKGSKTFSEYMSKHGFKPHGDKKIMYNGKQERGYVNIRWATELDKVQNVGYTD